MKRKYENNLLFHVFNILEINYFLEKKLFFDSFLSLFLIINKNPLMSEPTSNCNHPCPHKSCMISALRGLRNGIYYGGRIRLMHSLVMAILFRNDSPKNMLREVLINTYQHAKSLGLFVFFYKSLVCLLNRLRGKNSKKHAVLSGFVVGLLVFGMNQSSINYQIILYLLSRVVVGGVQRFAKKKKIGKMRFFPYLAMICWASGMVLFEIDQKALQSSMASSLVYLFKESDKPMKHWTELIPFEKPVILDKLMKF